MLRSSEIGIHPSEQTYYRISGRTEKALINYVNSIPKKPMEPLVEEDSFAKLNLQKLTPYLPGGLTEQDLINIVRLSMFTECKTDTYAEKFVAGARAAGAKWLEEFTTNFWVPDEYRHTAPFKKMLMRAGFSEEELDKDIKAVQEKSYEHKAGSTPMHLTIYGKIQEDLTDNWYGLTNIVLLNALPSPKKDTRPNRQSTISRVADQSPLDFEQQQAVEETIRIINGVKGRETLHRRLYQDMSALQFRDNPELFSRYVAAALAHFGLPGREFIPELQGQARGWIPKMTAGPDGNENKETFRNMEQFIVTHLDEALGMNTAHLGEVVTHFGAIKSPIVRAAERVLELPVIRNYKESVYLIVGQAIREKEGINPNKALNTKRLKLLDQDEREVIERLQQEEEFRNKTARIRNIIVWGLNHFDIAA